MTDYLTKRPESIGEAWGRIIQMNGEIERQKRMLRYLNEPYVEATELHVKELEAELKAAQQTIKEKTYVADARGERLDRLEPKLKAAQKRAESFDAENTRLAINAGDAWDQLNKARERIAAHESLLAEIVDIHGPCVCAHIKGECIACKALAAIPEPEDGADAIPMAVTETVLVGTDEEIIPLWTGDVKTGPIEDAVHTCEDPAYCSYCREHAGR